MTRTEAEELMRQLQSVFDMVRLVRADGTTQHSLGEDGVLRAEGRPCYSMERRGQCCEHCVVQRVLTQQGRTTKFEFLNDKIYQMTAKYLEIQGEPWVLELINEIGADTMVGTVSRDSFMRHLNDYNRKLYLDATTGAHSRRYYEELLCRADTLQTLAIMDLDHFKEINDTWGHGVGDAALRTVIQTVVSCVRSTDTVIRYGGDEFLVVFRDIPREAFLRRLEQIRQRITDLRLDFAPELSLSVSIGGCYGPARPEELLERADDLLYRAKARRNCVCVV